MSDWSQQDQRVAADENHTGDFFLDQFGREYHAEVEIKTGHPCSPLRPVGWTDPLHTPSHYITVLRGRRNRQAAAERHDLRVEFPRWITDWREAGKRWDADAMKRAIALKGADWDKRKGFPPEVLLEMGQRPGATLQAVIAASQGNKYVLGMRPFDPTNAKDVALQAILNPPTVLDEMDWRDEPAEKPKRTRKLVAVAAVAAGVDDEAPNEAPDEE